MMVVTVEVWPGGRLLRRRVIHTMNLANVSELADVSDYEGAIDGEDLKVVGHNRATGAWKLVQRALEQADEDGLI